jgi:hypothetical protein
VSVVTSQPPGYPLVDLLRKRPLSAHQTADQHGADRHAVKGALERQDQARSEPPAYQPFAWAELDEVFAQADVISLHCPLTSQTAGLVNRRRLELVKPSFQRTVGVSSRSSVFDRFRSMTPAAQSTSSCLNSAISD